MLTKSKERQVWVFMPDYG